MAKHALLSASSAERWINCPPSALINAAYADTSSVYAQEGTVAHELAEMRLYEELKLYSKQKITAWKKRIEKMEGYYEGMIDDVESYVTFVIEEYKAAQKLDEVAEIEIEAKLDYSAYAPEGYGTGDAVILCDQYIHVIDLKFGKGVVVDPTHNAQLMLYGLGAYLEYGYLYDVDEVRVTIAQVRLGEINTFSIGVEDLLKWAKDVVRPAAKLAYEGQGEYKPGDHCMFCKYKGKCKARTEEALSFYEKSKGANNPEEVAQILPRLAEFVKWAKDLEEQALEDILSGVDIPGWKAVEGRSIRKITAPEELAVRLLEDYEEEEIYKPKELQTLTALEKLVGKKAFSELAEPYISKPPGKPTLAPLSDKRPALDDYTNDLDFE